MSGEAAYQVISVAGHTLIDLDNLDKFGQPLLREPYGSLVFSKWMRSLYHSNPIMGKIPSDTYYKNYTIFLRNLLQKPDSVVKMAVLSDDHDVVLGFSVSREDVLDYVHVHRDYRKIGICKNLMPIGTSTFSHITLTWLIIWQDNDKYKHLKFNPFA